jgi:hypothetical protein
MNDTYIIEISDMAVGIVIGERAGYRFFASSQAFHSIDGRLYPTPRAAETSARALAEQLRKVPVPRAGRAVASIEV